MKLHSRSLETRGLSRWLAGLALGAFVAGAAAQSNLVLLVSPAGEYIGQGRTYFTTNVADFNVSLYPGPLPPAVQATAFGFILTLAGPGGAAPTVGIYTNATRYPLQGSNPGLSLHGNGRGCNSVCGNFQVFEFATDGSGNLTRFWATFSQRCECGGAPLTGELRFNSALAPPTPLPRTLRVPAEYPTIQSAVDSATILSLDQVLVDPGLYFESVQLGGKRVQLVSAAGPTATYVAATNGVAIAVSGATPDTLIQGFTLMDSGTGIGIGAGGSPTIISNAIVNCGTGINCDSGNSDNRGSPLIRGNRITGCAGAAIQLSFTGTPVIETNYLEDNGGGIGMWEAGNVTIRNNVIRRNQGDGFWMYNYSSADIVQNLIVENGGNGVSWVAPGGSRGPWLINNTIAGNRGSGIAASSYGDGAQIINNIVVGDPALSAGPALPVIQFNNFYSRTGNTFNGVTNLTGLDGNISANPFFVCEPAGDYHLLASSACLDAGTNGAPLLPPQDFDGQPRIQPATTNGVARVDLGAFELNPVLPAVSPCLFVFCPADILAVTAPGSNATIVTFPPPFATPGATVTDLPPSGTNFPEGTNLVTRTVTLGTNSTQCSFRVTVLTPPTIVTTPVGLLVAAGSTTNLTVGGQGSAPLRYQWWFENTSLAGATNATVGLTNLQASNEGFYRVVVTNAVGAITSAPVLIKVLPAAPTVVTGPVNLTVPAGTNASFQVNALGSSPLWYTWHRDGSPVAVTTAPQLVISNVQSLDAGAYHVVVSNLLGTAVSSGASLVVTAAAPHIVTQPPNPPTGFLLTGSSYTATALVRGSEPISYQWRRSNTNLPGLTNTFLTLSNVTSANSGQYTLRASNSYGAVTSAVVFISVSGTAPAFTQQPASREVLVGSSVTFNSLATGTSPLTYQWKFHGTNLPAQTNRQLTLFAVTAAHNGPYFVTASNAIGTTNSLVAQLLVNQSLLLSAPLSNQVLDAGATATLAVGITSTGAVTYAWQWNGTPLPDTTSALTLTNVQPGHSGFYRVTASNPSGSLTSTGRLSVLGPVSSVLAWGDDSARQTTVPAGLNDVVAAAGGDFHTVALHHDGTLIAWGDNTHGQTNVPASPLRFVAVAAGADHSLAVTENGTVVAWGRNESGQCTVPSSAHSVLAVAAGDSHSLALTGIGTVLAWGDNTLGQCSVPGGLSGVRAIAAGRHHNLALRQDGTVVAWGLNSFGQATPPAGLNDVAAIAAGYLHSVALRSNGTVVVWGDNTYLQTDFPPELTNVVAIAAGDYHSLALRAGGGVVGWGNNWLGQTEVPPLNPDLWAIASGYYHGLALRSLPLLRLRLLADRFVVEWSGAGMLQWAPSPVGPYEDLPGLTGAYTNSDYTLPAKFFRLKR